MAEYNELRGDQFDNWGKSIWYLELDDFNYPNRQIQVYEIGIRLKYSQQNQEDIYGTLGDQSIEEDDYWGIEISNNEFEKEWNINSFNNSK